MKEYFEQLVRHNFRNGVMRFSFENKEKINHIKGNYYGKHKIQI